MCNKEAELNALYIKTQTLEEEIATLHHKKLIFKKLETTDMSLKGVLGVIFETEEEEKEQYINIIYMMVYMLEKKYVNQDMNIELTPYIDNKQVFGSWVKTSRLSLDIVILAMP